MDWIHLAQGGDQWRAFVNRVMNLWVSQNFKAILEWLSDWWLLKTGSIPTILPLFISWWEIQTYLNRTFSSVRLPTQRTT
jgi:hypothetical protein